MERSTRSNNVLSSSALADAVNIINNLGRRRPAHDLPPLPPPPKMSHISIDKDLPLDCVPASANVFHSNFYIKPFELLNFLDKHEDEFFVRDKLNLIALRDYFSNLDANPQPYEEFWRADRMTDAFIENEYYKLHAQTTDTKRKDWLFPYLISNDTVLSIPGIDVFDLPIYVMMYILLRLTQFPQGHRSFTVSYSLEVSSTQTIYPVYDDRDKPIRVINGRINTLDFQTIYMTIIRKYTSLLPEHNAETSWNGSEDSGTRVILQNFHKSFRLWLKLVLTPTPSINHAHGWTQKVEDLIKESVGTSVMSVRNRNDNKCLIYCVILGLITKIKEGGARVFGASTLMVEDDAVYCKGTYYFAQESDEVSCLIRKLSKLLLPPTYSEAPQDPLVKFVEDIDKKAGTLISVTDFQKEFSEIEQKLIPENICGIDVYGLDFNVNRHIYPLYMSKNREKVIELLCVTPLDAECSHYCLIVNMEKLMKGTGGKQFFSCTKCGQCFYHRRLLKDHKCPVNPDHTVVDGEGGYHYSDKIALHEHSVVVGSCSKCRLCFTDEFSYNYHMEHCLMQGQTGYRHVQLKTYKINETPTLNGEEIDLEQENNHVKRRRVMYADFESTIDPETGEHSFMSYGIYDWKSGVYKC